jgi:hypothetical protein
LSFGPHERRTGVGLKPHQKPLRGTKLLVGVCQPEFDARSFVGHTPVEHEQEDVALEDLPLVQLEHRSATLIRRHQIIRRSVALHPVALRQEHLVVSLLESLGNPQVEDSLRFGEQRSSKVDEHHALLVVLLVRV